MIFEPSKLEDKKFRNQFAELVSVYVRLVECYAEKNALTIPDITIYSTEMLKEMKQMGVIDKLHNVDFLRKMLEQTYHIDSGDASPLLLLILKV